MADLNIDIYDEIVTLATTDEIIFTDISVFSSAVITETVAIADALDITVADDAWAWDEPDPGGDPNPVINLFQHLFRTDPPPKLPVVSCEAAFRESFSIISTVPVVSGVGGFGTVVEGNVPTPTAAITLSGLYAGYITVAAIVPTSDGRGVFGSTVKGKVPTVSCVATLANQGISVSGYAPVAIAELEIFNNGISVTGYAPFPSVQAALTADGYITVTGKAPVVIGNMTVSEAGLIIITGIVPVAKVEYGNIQTGGNTISVSGTAPVVTMFHPTGEEDPGGISIFEDDRFDDITLQYRRWSNAV